MKRRTLLRLGALLGFGWTFPAWARAEDGSHREVLLTAKALLREPGGWWQADLEAAQLTGDAAAFVIGTTESGAAARQLTALWKGGRASGLEGVLYDNRDRNHSPLPPAMFPQLTHVRYDPDLRQAGADNGLAWAIRFPAVTLGNSSTALEAGPAPRSLVRLAMTASEGPSRTAALYRNGHLYVYPEHQDHDDADLYPANWPYTITSQGSSYSDQPHLQALAMSLAALRPDTRDRTWLEGLTAPTLQMIYRRGRTGMGAREMYLSGQAHPSAFDPRSISPAAMIGIAQTLTPEEIPPAVRLAVTDEDFTTDAGLAKLSERLFDTDSAVARIWRSQAWQRQITLSARETRDPNGRPLSFVWKVLRGNPDWISITHLDARATMARIEVQWHDPRPVFAGGILSNRVDIGVFADNGTHLSAPAFLSISFPTHELREYEDSPQGMRLMSVDYDADGRGATYDPLLHWSARWTDYYSYGPSGDPTGWIRRHRSADHPAARQGIPYSTKDRRQRYILESPIDGRRSLTSARV